MRIFKHRTLASVLFTVLAMALAAGPAAASVETANAIAQNYQNGECGRGATWLCNNARYVPASCFNGGSSIGYYQCNGTVKQVSFLGDYRWCNIYTNVQKGTGVISYHRNTCLH